VFGQIKQARGFRQFLMRGIAKMRAEWAIVCTAHNLLKLAQGLSAARLIASKQAPRQPEAAVCAYFNLLGPCSPALPT
jgi:Transposase DDE domain